MTRLATATAISSAILPVAVTALTTLTTSCTSKTESLPDGKPDEKKYADDADVLVKTSQKFADETDVRRLHEIAKAMQTTRTLACIDYNGECTLFGKFLSHAIRLSAKGSLTASERKELRDRASEIRLAVENGKRKIREHRKKL